MYRQKKKGGGREEAGGHSTVRGAPQNGDGRVEADFAIMFSRITKFVYFQRGAKNFRLRLHVSGYPDV